MLKKLRNHWMVNDRELFLILCTFAVTGTTTAWLSKKVAEWLLLEKYGVSWWTSKIMILLFGYQIIILIVGFCFGMFAFFWKYEKKILLRLGLMKRPPNNENQNKIRMAIFASGAGSNAQQIINYFRENKKVKIALIVCNKPNAGVLKIAEKENIPVLLIEKTKFVETGYVQELKDYEVNFIVLAGFLWKIPSALISCFQNRIVNIHPALLPAFGGKGMYGHAVHCAVIAAKEKESGITIHYVDEKYDHGKIIFQARCTVSDHDTAESLAQKIHQLEHEFYPQIIDAVVNETIPA